MEGEGEGEVGQTKAHSQRPQRQVFQSNDCFGVVKEGMVEGEVHPRGHEQGQEGVKKAKEEGGGGDEVREEEGR